MRNSTKRENILIIESDLKIASQICTLCFALGFEPLVAQDGFTGVLLARRLKPRLIFSDLAVPGMNGFEIVRHIRRLPELQHCAIVAISGDAPGRSAENQPGFDDLALKPLSRARLEHVIGKFCASLAA